MIDIATLIKVIVSSNFQADFMGPVIVRTCKSLLKSSERMRSSKNKQAESRQHFLILNLLSKLKYRDLCGWMQCN